MKPKMKENSIGIPSVVEKEYECTFVTCLEFFVLILVLTIVVLIIMLNNKTCT